MNWIRGRNLVRAGTATAALLVPALAICLYGPTNLALAEAADAPDPGQPLALAAGKSLWDAPRATPASEPLAALPTEAKADDVEELLSDWEYTGLFRPPSRAAMLRQRRLQLQRQRQLRLAALTSPVPVTKYR